MVSREYNAHSTNGARVATMRAVPTQDECPCGSRRPYQACCEPFHRGELEAPDAEALMRSRFAAFAKKETAYLWRTLHPDHQDRAVGEAQLVRDLQRVTSVMRYAGLTILDRREPGEDGIAQVLFFARVFDKKGERSFVELSDFAHDGEGWRYLSGKTLPLPSIKSDPMALTIATFPVRNARS
jgi:SEC-C motif-containing protein